eukprot:gene5544-3999_t
MVAARLNTIENKMISNLAWQITKEEKSVKGHKKESIQDGEEYCAKCVGISIHNYYLLIIFLHLCEVCISVQSTPALQPFISCFAVSQKNGRRQRGAPPYTLWVLLSLSAVLLSLSISMKQFCPKLIL